LKGANPGLAELPSNKNIDSQLQLKKIYPCSEMELSRIATDDLLWVRILPRVPKYIKIRLIMNRRDFIKNTITVAAVSPLVSLADDGHTHLSVANKLTTKGKSFDPTNEPKRIRKSFYDLTDEELRTFMKAVGYMRNNLKLEDPLQWDNYAKIHALHCTEANEDHPPVHWSWNFLPWHRGYLYFLERILADCINKQGLDGSKFALPYWDWTVHKEMPNTKERKKKGLPSPFFGYDRSLEDMVSPDGLDFDNSALFEGNRGPSVEKPEIDSRNELTQDSKDHVTETLGFFSLQYINLMLSTPWEQFLGSPTTDRTTGQGLLEQGPHNDGHDWVGTRFGKNRSMGTLRTAAGDPMFYMHHGNIDRIWSLYKQPQPDPSGDWGKQEYNFLDVDGSVLTLSVKDIIEKTTNISYTPSNVKLQATLKKVYDLSRNYSATLGTEIETSQVSITAPENLFNYNSVMLTVETGPIPYTGRYTLKVLADGKYIGKLNFLDGEYRDSYSNKDVTHKFNLLLTNIPKGARILTFVPPKKETFKLFIKSLTYKPI
jgi:polyphenol oxidase